MSAHRPAPVAVPAPGFPDLPVIVLPVGTVVPSVLGDDLAHLLASGFDSEAVDEAVERPSESGLLLTSEDREGLDRRRELRRFSDRETSMGLVSIQPFAKR